MGPHGILFDVAHHAEQMRVLLDRKRFEPPLPHMTTRVVPPVIPSNMRRQQPLHPPAEFPIEIGPQGQVKMVGHQTVRQYSHRDSLGGIAQELDERLVVSVPMKHLSAGIAAIDDVITISTD
jgi:hypothetical protein